MKLIPPTTSRVQDNTPDALNMEIEDQTLKDLARMMGQGPDAIAQRLKELDREWDIERALEAHAAAVALIGLVLGFKANRKWFMLPVAVAGFLLQHAIQGWCPPMPLMRKLGFRTATEINAEKTALRILQGDFGALADLPLDALRMAEDGASLD
jgi:hypothetical protein